MKSSPAPTTPGTKTDKNGCPDSNYKEAGANVVESRLNKKASSPSSKKGSGKGDMDY